MRILTLMSCLLFVNFAFAGNDSMAFFWNSNQTTVVINENSSTLKLKDFIQSTGLGNSFNLQSKSGDVIIQCKTASGAASCTFKFKKSNEIELQDKYLFAYSDSENTTAVRALNLAQGEFENAKGERFAVWLDQFQIVAEAIKP
ncbi:MAG: hypothetical protein V4654_04925 [Bdellovibrionota bacterium]